MSMKSVVLVLVRKILPAVAGLALLVGVIAWLAGLFTTKIEPGRTEVAARQVSAGQPTAAVHEVVKQYVEEAVGTLEAERRAAISSKILATVEEILVSAGDRVKKGELLARLSSADLEARLQQAKDALAAAEATRLNAETDFRRVEQLKATKSVSQADYDAADARLRVAKAEEARAEQAVKEAQVKLSYATIDSPMVGRVVDRLVEPGDTVAPGQALLTMYDPSTLRLEAPVREELRSKIEEGQKLTVRIDALDREIEATVDQIVPQAERMTRSFLVKASVSSQADLFEGMSGRLLIPAGARRHLCLPTAAVVTIGQLDFVDVVGDDGTLERRLVELGRLGLPGKVEVLSGLRSGERVLLHKPADESAGNG